MITVTQSPNLEDYDDDNPPPWRYEPEAFCTWVHETFLEGYKREVLLPSVEEAISIVEKWGYEVEVTDS